MKYYTIVLDGIDKSGKDTIARYIWLLDNRLKTVVRGWPSLYAYNKKYNRNTDYELPYKNALYVKLNVNYEDWKIRCDITNEPKIDYQFDKELFAEAFHVLQSNGYNVVAYNTTEDTAYTIALAIVNKMKSLNGEVL